MRRDRSPASLVGVLAVWFVPAFGGSGVYRVPTESLRVPAPVLRTVGVGRAPAAIAVDERAGRAFVVGRAGSVTVLDAATGAVVRTVAVGHSAQAVAVDTATGRAFVTDPGRVFTLDARSGAVLRASSVGGGGPTGALTVDARHGEVFVAARGVDRGLAGSGPGSIVVLDAATGLPRRTIHADADLMAVDGIARRLIVPYACAGGDALTTDACADTLDAATGHRLKTVDVGGEQGFTQVLIAVAVDVWAGRALVLYGDGRGDSDVGVLATRTGSRLGTIGGAGGTLGTIALDGAAGRAVVAVAPDSYMGANGHEAPLTAVVSVVDTRAGRAIGGADIRTKAGDIVYVPGASADARRGRFYVAATPSAGGTSSPRSVIAVLDARGGHLLRTVTLPSSVTVPNASVGPAMAVDGRTGRLFIANGNDNTVSVLDTARL